MAIELTQADLEILSEIRQALGIATPKEIFPEAVLGIVLDSGTNGPLSEKMGTRVNFKPLSQFGLIQMPSSPTPTLSAIEGAEFLHNLQDRGTQNCLNLNGYAFSAATLNQFFTNLPAITNGRTATIDVRSNPGTATCNPSIATAKGYTIVTE
jgi:hypothetical protein